MIAVSFVFLLLSSGNEIVSLSRFVIPDCQSVPSFSLTSQPVFLVSRFLQAYNQLQQDGLP